MMSIVYGPKWPFYSCWDYIALFGTGICRFCIRVELLVQRRLYSIFREKCRVTRHSRVFRGLTGSQRTPVFLGVTTKDNHLLYYLIFFTSFETGQLCLFPLFP